MSPKKPKLGPITPGMLKRYEKTEGRQSKGMACIICGASWDDCPHSFADMDKVITAIETGKLLGLLP